MDIKINLLDSQSSLDEELDRGLYQTIYECFSEPPFNEKVTRKKVIFKFEKYGSSGHFMLIWITQMPV